MGSGAIDDKRILVTGACGSVGSELIRVLSAGMDYRPGEVIGIDNNETELFSIEQQYIDNRSVRFYLADVRDSHKIKRAMQGIDIVFHTAALKHVVVCERSPFEAVQTNIHGVQNIIQAAMDNRVGKVIFTSSDKAVNPTNVMGTSKLMGEKLITAANSNHFRGGTLFSSTRFGNVLGSRGSVIPIFHQQIRKGGPVTLTDPAMTRFIMSIRQAAELVIHSSTIARGGEVLVTKMPVMAVQDLAEVMIEALAPVYNFRPQDIEITKIGTKPGEKLYEELMSQEETRRSIELKDYFAILPAFRGLYRDIPYDYEEMKGPVTNPYVSAHEPRMSHSDILSFLTENHLLDTDPLTENHPDRRYWPGDKKER